ncbi:conjugative transposon protein TraN [Flavobacterium daejeonense]|uniref:conjugative transposon protein TraN n=1 Tax=Flavobacterium daejeonense TaxID=350893 RepID=UPI000479E18A|nr:conjugative transposon protein TraN [Flavobacterium daejeonense]
MKNKLFFLAALIFFSIASFAQNDSVEKTEDYISRIKDAGMQGQQAKEDLTWLFITDDVSIHFRSPEPIQYVDISSNLVVGDLPVENVLRIKYVPENDTLKKVNVSSDNEVAIVTVVGQSFLAQYRINYTQNKDSKLTSTEIEIQPKDMKPLEFPKVTLTNNELKSYSYELLKRKPTFKNVTSKSLGLIASLNNIYSFGDYIFLDVSYKNRTNIKYDFNEVRFKIEDKKIFKATNVQELEVKPDFTLYNNKSFRKNFRNIYVFKKFTFPNSKVLNIQLTEEQISGRMIELKIDYRDLLNADTL